MTKSSILSSETTASAFVICILTSSPNRRTNFNHLHKTIKAQLATNVCPGSSCSVIPNRMLLTFYLSFANLYDVLHRLPRCFLSSLTSARVIKYSSRHRTDYPILNRLVLLVESQLLSPLKSSPIKLFYPADCQGSLFVQKPWLFLSFPRLCIFTGFVSSVGSKQNICFTRLLSGLLKFFYTNKDYNSNMQTYCQLYRLGYQDHQQSVLNVIPESRRH